MWKGQCCGPGLFHSILMGSRNGMESISMDLQVTPNWEDQSVCWRVGLQFLEISAGWGKGPRAISWSSTMINTKSLLGTNTPPSCQGHPTWQCLRTDCPGSGPSGNGLGGLTAGEQQIEHELSVCSCRDEGQLLTAGKWVLPLLGTDGATAGTSLLFWAVTTRERPASGGGHQDTQETGACAAWGEAAEAGFVWPEEEEVEGEDLAVVLPCQKEGLEKERGRLFLEVHSDRTSSSGDVTVRRNSNWRQGNHFFYEEDGEGQTRTCKGGWISIVGNSHKLTGWSLRNLI